MTLESYLTLSEAARKYGISTDALTRLVKAGIIRAARINGWIAVAEEDVSVSTMRDKIWNQVKHLDGTPISMSQACEKYDEINFASLSRWVDRGYIRTLGDGPRGGGRGRKRLLNEADVAYTAFILRRRGKRPGKRVFAPETLPPHLIPV